MARAYGSSAHLLMKRETVYGQAATGNYLRMPFNRCNLGSDQGLIDDPVLGQGRDPLAPLRLGPSGHVVGVGMDAVLRMAAARAYDLSGLSELLPAAEAGLVEASCNDRVREGGVDQV
jgi:hypothetical protein